MENRKLQWIKVASSENELLFTDNNMAPVAAANKHICIARYQDGLFAFAGKCPHASGILSEGYVDALGNVVCPLHRYKFCIKNGRNVSGEGYYLKHWPVKVEAAGVFVGFEILPFEDHL